MVTFLWRANGSPKATGANPFTDVQADAYYYDAVLWAVEKGITSGTSATTFAPDATVTRGQTVTFLHRANGSRQFPAAARSMMWQQTLTIQQLSSGQLRKASPAAPARPRSPRMRLAPAPRS